MLLVLSLLVGGSWQLVLFVSGVWLSHRGRTPVWRAAPLLFVSQEFVLVGAMLAAALVHPIPLRVVALVMLATPWLVTAWLGRRSRAATERS